MTYNITKNIDNRRAVRLWAIKCAERVIANISNQTDRATAKGAIIAAKKFLVGEIDVAAMQTASVHAAKTASHMETHDECVAGGGRPQIDAALAAAAAASTDDNKLNYAGWHAANSVYNIAMDEQQHRSEVARQLTELDAIMNAKG